MPVTYRLLPGATTYPDSTTYPGVVGAGVELKVLIDLGDPTTASPNWQYLSENRVFSFSTSRGRESTLAEIDAGTATLVVDNRDRAFDPTFATSPYYPYIRPMTRFWLQSEVNGVAESQIVAYADSFGQGWPGWGGSEAICTIALTDEFKVLALNALPTTAPPRTSYADVIQADRPAGYWPMQDDPAQLIQAPEPPPSATEAPVVPAPGGAGPWDLGGKVYGDTWGL